MKNLILISIIIVFAAGVTWATFSTQYDRHGIGRIESTTVRLNIGRTAYPADAYSRLDNGKTIDYFLDGEEVDRCLNKGVAGTILKGTPVVMYKTLGKNWFEFNGVAHKEASSLF